MKLRLDFKQFLNAVSSCEEICLQEMQSTDQNSPAIILDTDNYLAMWDAERRPVYAIRGKPVSKETAFEIIRKTDNYLHQAIDHVSPDESIIRKSFEGAGVHPQKYSLFNMFENNWFPRPEELACGWCHPDGYIGTTDYSKIKNPFPYEMLHMWYFLMNEVTPDLDLIAIVLDVSERLMPHKSITSQIAFGIWVKGLELEVLDKKRASQIFKKYDTKYGDHNLVRPIRDPAVLGLKTFMPYTYTLSELDHGGWCSNIGSCNHFLDLSGSHEDGALIPAIEGKVDKNNVMYYGVPDFTYHEGPMTLKDLEAFVEKWKSELDEEGGT